MADNDMDFRGVGLHTIEVEPGAPPVVSRMAASLERLKSAIETFTAVEVKILGNANLSAKGKTDALKREAGKGLKVVESAESLVEEGRTAFSGSVVSPWRTKRGSVEKARRRSAFSGPRCTSNPPLTGECFRTASLDKVADATGTDWPAAEVRGSNNSPISTEEPEHFQGEGRLNDPARTIAGKYRASAVPRAPKLESWSLEGTRMRFGSLRDSI